jgi:O-antigen ligase
VTRVVTLFVCAALFLHRIAMLLTFGLIVLSLAFLLPGHYPPWPAFEQEAAAAIGGGLVGLALLAHRAQRKVAVPPLALCFSACAGIALCQWAAGQIRFAVDAVLAAAYLTAFATTVVLGACTTEEQRRALTDGLGLALIAAGIASTGLAAAQWLGQSAGIWLIDLRPGGRPYANLAQPNHLSTLLALATMATLKRFEQRSLAGPVAVLALAWFGFGIVMTQSRTGWLFVALLIGWWAVMRRRVALRSSTHAVVGGAVAFFALVWGWEALSRALLLPSGALEERLHAGTRWLHWQTLWDAIGRAPWLGYGWQQIGLAQQASVLDHPASGEWLEHSHNLLLDLLLWNGVPLGLLLFAALMVWFARRIRDCRTAERWAVLGSVGAVFVHALLEYPLDYAYFLLPAGFMVGALEGEAPPGRQALRVPRAAVAAVLAAQLALLGFVAAEYLRVQEATRQLRFMLVQIAAPDGAVPLPPSVRLLDAPREFHRFWLRQAKPGMSAVDLDWMRRVSQRYPVPAAMLRYALAAGLNGRAAEATSTLGRLCKMHPSARCEEARAAWTGLQGRHPELRGIPPPAVLPGSTPAADRTRRSD